MGLRKYQVECHEAIHSARRRGVKKGLVVASTGLGKTVIFSHLPEAMDIQPGEQMLVVVHRDELAEQAISKISKYNPALKITLEKAENYADLDADVIVASVQTIGRNKLNTDTKEYEWGKRISRLDPDKVKYIVLDEAHHATSSSWRGVLAYFGALKGTKYDNGTKFVYGFTATPNRADSEGLGQIFDEIVWRKDIVQSVAEGWLCDIRAYRVDTSVDISGVSVTKGDFAVKELEKTVNTPARNNLIVEKYIELANDKRAIFFGVDVQHIKDVTQAFNVAGVRAAYVTGDMPKDERRTVLKMFKDGWYQIMGTVAVLTEGYDDPSIEVGLMGSPTKSPVRYTQSVGRILRPSPSPEEMEDLKAKGVTPEFIKTEAIIIDFCDVTGRHSLHTVPTLFGLHPKADLKGKKAGETAAEMEKIIAQKKLPLSLDSFESLEKLKAVAERVDLLKAHSVPDAVRRMSEYAWIEYAKDSYSLCLPNEGIIRVSQNMLGQWEVAKSNKGIKTVLGQAADLQAAIRRADSEVPPDAKILLSGQSNWRAKPVTDAQIGFLWKIDHKGRRGFPNLAVYGMAVRKQYPTAGMASDRINQLKGVN